MIAKVKSLIMMALFILGIAVLMCAMSGYVPDFHSRDWCELVVVSDGK